ncbi:acyltransferase family protein [Bradyrhizobium sp.]|uniref:acyltransferase family protein n=1 Tax=Bradyrhizobium sp. TaxID=376 RepID=UPI003BB09B3A
MSNAYRSDVDGLRAISVALVILFHLGLPGFGGGFIGVDVFFVISGFLITGVIFEGIEGNSFSLARFYDRRARRILPMLVTVVLASAVAGYVLLYPGDYRAFASSAIAALLGWSNIFFLHNTGYFDIPSQTMPLLHTWSLGVEEQFYLVWPAALVAGSKLLGRSKRVWVAIFTLVILVSFGKALTLAGRDPKADFYLPFTRAWELALGALIVVLPPAASFLPRRLIGALPAIGLGAIGYGTMTLSSEAPFPAFNALLPTLGAALVIFPRATTAQAVLGAWPLRFLGLISYSLYLWHWPLIVFWRVYSNSLFPTPLEMLAIVAIAMALSVLSWRFIEQPARRIKISSPTVLTTAFCGDAIALGVIASILYADGLPSRLPPEMAALDGKDRMWAWTCPQSVALGILANSSTTTAPSCAYGANWKTARHRAIIWGDSLAEHLAPVLDVAGRKTDTSIALAYACAAITQSGAPRNIAADLTPRYEDWCDASRTRVLSLITGANEIDTVLLSTSWSFLWPLLDLHSEAKARDILRAGLEDLLDKIIAAGKRPIIIADAPASLGPDPANCVLALHALPRRPCTIDPAFIDLATIHSQTETHAILKRLVALRPGAAIVDPMDFLCDATRCNKFVAGELIYRDAVHLRRNLSPAAISAMAEGLRLEKVLGKPQ